MSLTHSTRKSGSADPRGSTDLRPWPSPRLWPPLWRISTPRWKHHQVSGVVLFFTQLHTSNARRTNSPAVCKRSTCAGVYLHMWQRFARARAPASVCGESVLLSPSTVLIKAGGGRREVWTEEEEKRMYGSLIYVMAKVSERKERLETQPSEQ